MRKRLLYASAIILLVLSVTLVVWQQSFHFGQYGPADPTQTFIYWAISTLIFLLMVTLAFILGRTGLKLYIERRSNVEGSRIKIKMVAGALVLSFMPVSFLLMFSVQVLNRNLAMWFARPAEAEHLTFVEIARTLRNEVQDEASLQARLLAMQPEVRTLLQGGEANGFLEAFCKEEELSAAVVLRAGTEARLASCGSTDVFTRRMVQPDHETMVFARAPVMDRGKAIGTVEIASPIPVDIVRKQQAITRYNSEYAELAGQRRMVRDTYLRMLALITLFILFVATWLALFLSKQISVPISALLKAAEEVRKGNLSYRVHVGAIDELVTMVRAFNDMTQDLETNSRELDARRRFTEAILESIPTGVLSVSAEGAIRRVNHALNKIFPEEVVTRAARLEDLFSREDTAELRYMMKRARRTGVTSRAFDLQVPSKTLHLSVTVSALEERITSGFVLVIEDTSDLLRAQKAAAWNEVARRVAHEIKNPLTPIALSAERIARQLSRIEAPPETKRILTQCAETIATSVESVKTLVDEFSQFARFPAARPARGDLNEVVASAVDVFEGRLDGIELRTELAQDLPPVNIDREQFQRAIVNLVDNAAEAMQDSLVKKLLIATQPGVGDSVELVVADTGCGVSPEDKEKLFLPYFSTKGRGTGLGLAIVNHILSDHQAHIRVEDNRPAGTRFIIDLPAMADTESAAAEESVAAAQV